MRTPCSLCGSPSVGRQLCRKHYLRWYKHGDPEIVKPRSPQAGRKGKRYEYAPRSTSPLDTPCREWQGLRTAKGYGTISRARRHWGVHRWVWSLVNGPIPDGMFVLHRCDNPPCFRLDHLYLGTPADNTLDMVRRGRARNGSSKLTAGEVVAIREQHALGVAARDIAIDYGVSRSAITLIITGKRWANVGGPIRTAHRPRRHGG